ncbi:AraC family transcriptional regulator [Mesorhizobium sp. L-8-3]|nr:AraC family transcriptional regulator [Mesorhizobium sp. L-8-3]
MDGLETALQYVQRDVARIDRIPRPVVAIGLKQVANRLEVSEHQHRRCELIYTVKGVLTCEIERSLWTVSPQSAVWIPSGTPHKCQAFGKTEYYVLFFDPNVYPNLPRACCTMSVSPLLREALIRAAQFSALYPLDGPEVRLLPVILDELSAARTEDHRLPLPSDPSLRRLADMMMSAPDDKSSVAQWAARCAMSERTLSRKMRHETGMSLWRWRHQLHVTLALQRMASGDSVQAVALDLGYETASSFITMFKKTTGKPPGRYFAERGSDDDTRGPRKDAFSRQPGSNEKLIYRLMSAGRSG